MGRRPGRRPRAGRGEGPPQGLRTQFSRCLPALRPVQDLPSVGDGERSGRRGGGRRGRGHAGQTGRSGCLRGRRSRRLFRGAHHAGRPPGRPAGGYFLRNRSGNDVERHDRPVFAEAHPQGSIGRDYPVPRNCRRSRIDCVPVVEGARRNGDRHGRFGGEMRARQGARRRPLHQLPQGEFCRARQGAHRRQGRAGRVRLGRKRHLHRIARLPAATRIDGELRKLLGRGSPVRGGGALAKRLALPHAPDLGYPYLQARRSGGDREGPVRRRALGKSEDRSEPSLCAQGCRSGTARPRSAQDDRFDDPDPVADPRMGELASLAVPGLFPEIEPRASGMLRLDAAHSMYWEESGDPDGIPAVFLHGGPGAGSTPKHRRFFDPGAYRIIVYDQRGAGRSPPLGELRDNTTPHLVADLETLRVHLRVERWVVFGGSWGSTLAIAYAEAHPERCLALILRGIFLCRRSEIEWFLYGLRGVFPEPWEKFAGFLPSEERGDLLRNYHRRLIDPDPAVHMPAARAWSIYEGSCSTLLPSSETVAYFAGDVVALGLARIEAHYFMNDIFLPENSLLENAHRLSDIPGTIVQGRYDMVCPLVSAHELHRAWPQAEYRIVPDAGHSAWEPGILGALVEATERFKRTPSFAS